MQNYISHLAYLGIGSGSVVFIVLLGVNFLFDRDQAYTKETRSNWLTRIYVVLMYIGGSALIATSMYVAFTPVGSNTIFGCQARYLIPLIFPLLSIWSMNGIKSVIPQKLLYGMTIVGCYSILFYQIYTMFLPLVIMV